LGTAAAFEAAIEHLRPLSLRRLLMIAGDLPLLTSSALDRLIAAAPERGVVLAPDRQSVGTNALLCSPPDVIPPCFGPNSFRRHVELAERAGVPVSVVDAPTLTFDVDVPEDLGRLRHLQPDSRVFAHAHSACAAIPVVV
jgi:2-phospho-L-lactate guanylyltransferase